jgi:hypothetical protein
MQHPVTLVVYMAKIPFFFFLFISLGVVVSGGGAVNPVGELVKLFTILRTVVII